MINVTEAVNETVQESVQYAVGKIQTSPPSPEVGLTGNLVLMTIGLFILLILYLKFKQLGKQNALAGNSGPVSK